MKPIHEDHIELPSALSDAESKKEYGRELAFSSLLNECFSASKKEQSNQETATARPTEAKQPPELKIPTQTDLPAPEKTIPFPNRTPYRLRKRALLAVAASIAAVTAWLYLLPDNDASGQNPGLVLTVESVKGVVNVAKSGSAESFIPGVGDRILSGDRIVTDNTSRIRLRYPDGTTIQVASSSDLLSRINPAQAPAKSLYLKNGRITVNANKQPIDARMTVLTPSATAEVVGTIFIIKATEDHTELIVNEGIVDLKRNNESKPMKVAAGLVAHVSAQQEKLEVIRPVITSFSLIDIKSGKPLPGYEEVMGDTLISYNEVPASGVGVRANISGLTDMVEIRRPDQKRCEALQEVPAESEEPDFIGYKAIDTSINPFPVTATPYSCNEGSGETKNLRIFFDD